MEGENNIIQAQAMLWRRNTRNKLEAKIRRLKAEMEGISEQQKCIKKEQRQVKQRFERIKLECDQIRNGTNLLMKQSVDSHLRLCLLSQILKARKDGNRLKAIVLVLALRKLLISSQAKV